MKKLKREEMKNVLGGGRPGPGNACTHPSQCGSGNNWDCVAGYTPYACVNGYCIVAKCS